MFPENHSVLIIGAPNARLFELCCYLGASYLRAGDKVVFLESNTSPAMVRQQMNEFGARAEEREQEGELLIIDAYMQPPSKEDPNAMPLPDLSVLADVFEALTRAIEKVGGPSVKVIFDSLTPLYIHHDPDAVGKFYKDASTMAKFNGSMTSIVHQGILDEDQIAGVSNLADAILEVKVDAGYRRFVRIKHLNGVLVAPKWVPFDFELDDGENGTFLSWNAGKSRD